MLKRTIDILAACLGLLVLAPILLFICLAIKLDSPGPIFFRQERVGRQGKLFRIFKFRTMSDLAAPDSLQITVAGNPRITRIGGLLRRYKLDELPQLIDVLRGTMSLVGPRPEVPKYVQHYPHLWRERLLSVRPGVTDLASVHYRNENELLACSENPEREYIEVILPDKLRYSLYYVDNKTIAKDFHVIGLTFGVVFAPAISSVRGVLSTKSMSFWSGVERWMSTLNRAGRAYAVLIDSVVVIGCWHAAYLFRLGFERWQPERPWYDDFVLIGVVASYLLAIAVFGVSRALWRFFCLDDFRRLIISCLSAGLFSVCWIQLSHLLGVSRAVLVLHPFFCILALALVRMSYRLIWEHASEQSGGPYYESKRAIVLGAGESACRMVAAIHRHQGWSVLAILDDDIAKHGLRVSGVGVQGCISELLLPHVLAGATHVLVAMPEADRVELDRVVEIAKSTGLTVLLMSDIGSMPDYGLS